MDIQRLKAQAESAGQTLQSYLRCVAEALETEQTEYSVGQSEALRQADDKIDAKQAARDSAVISDVAAKLKALRDEVSKLTAELDAAAVSRMQAGDHQVLATMRADVAKARAEVTEEIATAVRSTHDVLMAEIRGMRK